MLADYFLCASGGRADGLLREWRGLEHVEAARKRGNGVLLVTAHLGHWELGGLLLAGHGLPMTVVTLEEPTTELTRWRDAYRRRAGIHTIAVGPGHSFAFVEMLQALRRNEVVAMLVDRPYEGTGEAVRFFGRPAEFSSGPALLHQHTGAAVVPAFVLRNGTGHYTAFADAALPLAADAGLPQNTQLIASHFENIIRQHPEQWFNYVPIWREAS
jgi:KDO2-lipid IV(A) lauroyltransferase